MLTLPMAGASDMARAELWNLGRRGGGESAVPQAQSNTEFHS